MVAWKPVYLDSRFPNGCSVWIRTRTPNHRKEILNAKSSSKRKLPKVLHSLQKKSSKHQKKQFTGPKWIQPPPPKSVRWVPCIVIRDNWLGPCGTSTSWNFPMEFCHWLRKEEFPGWMAIQHLGLCEDELVKWLAMAPPKWLATSSYFPRIERYSLADHGPWIWKFGEAEIFDLKK